MVSEIPITRKQVVITSRIQETGGAEGPAQLSRMIAGETRRQRDNYQAQAMENAYLNGQVMLEREMTRISTENQNNPDAMTKALDEFGSSFLNEVNDPNMHARFKLQIERAASNEIAKATARRQAVIDDQSAFEALQSLDLLQNEFSNVAPELYSNDPAVALSAQERLQEITLRGTSIASMTNSQGQFIFTPQQRSSAIQGVRDGAGMAMVRAYFNTQEDKVQAAEDWLDGRVSVNLPNEEGGLDTINIRDMMPSDVRTKMDNEIIGMMRDRIAIDNHQLQMKDRLDEEAADAIYLEHRTRIQSGREGTDIPPMSLQELDLSRQAYLSGGKETEYFALRRLLIQGEPEVSDGPTRQALMSLAYSGLDPTQFGLSAMKDGKIRQEDLTQAQSVYSNKVGTAASPTRFWVNQTRRALGGENPALDPAKQEKIVRAELEVRRKIEAQELDLGRPVNSQEGEAIFNEVLNSYALYGQEDRLSATKPAIISNSELYAGAATKERADEFHKKILQSYIDKHQGDKDAIRNDPDYIKDLQWLGYYRNTIVEINKVGK